MFQKELEVLGVVHHAQPGAISITQSTEYGTLYSVEELKELIDICKGSGYVSIWMELESQMPQPH